MSSKPPSETLQYDTFTISQTHPPFNNTMSGRPADDGHPASAIDLMPPADAGADNNVTTAANSIDPNSPPPSPSYSPTIVGALLDEESPLYIPHGDDEEDIGPNMRAYRDGRFVDIEAALDAADHYSTSSANAWVDEADSWCCWCCIRNCQFFMYIGFLLFIAYIMLIGELSD